MRHADSTRQFGLIGVALIIASFLVWAFVLPMLKDETDDKPSGQQLQDITTPPAGQQSAPPRPASEPPKPMPPTQ